jgi:hypothetical protein
MRTVSRGVRAFRGLRSSRPAPASLVGGGSAQAPSGGGFKPGAAHDISFYKDYGTGA